MSAASARKRQTPETAVTHLFCFAAKLLTAQKRLQPLKSPLASHDKKNKNPLQYGGEINFGRGKKGKSFDWSFVSVPPRSLRLRNVLPPFISVFRSAFLFISDSFWPKLER